MNSKEKSENSSVFSPFDNMGSSREISVVVVLSSRSPVYGADPSQCRYNDSPIGIRWAIKGLSPGQIALADNQVGN